MNLEHCSHFRGGSLHISFFGLSWTEKEFDPKFPNINNIYLHDTPSKSHFAREERAFSHGCIRVAKPRDLAVKIMENDTTWTPQKIDAAMNAGVEKWYSLKEKIPVYIGYFTAWVDDNGKVFFYDDVYRRDDSLFDIIIGNNQLAVEETTAE